MDSNSFIAIFFTLTIIILILFNYKLIFNKEESFENNFTNSKCCCTENDINKCNEHGKSCVCDYFDKNKYLCQSNY